MDFLSSIRSLVASIDIFISGMISKVYTLLLQLADVNIANEFVDSVINRVYGIIGLFMLFKLVLVIINYIVDPDKQQSASKIVQRVIIALVLIPTVPAIFEKAYQLQGIILRDNIIGNIILGDGASGGNNELGKIGDEVGYLVFSNFLDYNVEGPLALAFSDCPNIFLEGDDTTNAIDLNYCCKPGPICPTLPKCAYYLYYPTTINPAYGMPDDEGIYPDSRDLYYKCKSGEDTQITIFPDWTHYCGVRDGKYIYDLINKARNERSVSLMLSSEIITAIETDPVFYKGVHPNVCNPKLQEYSDGDFIFEYNFILATLVGLVVTFLLIVICVNIAIRSVKLAFLQVISPIPIISYVDVKDSKLFNGWLKETITTYLQLFIRLAVVFFSILLFKAMLGSFSNNEIMVNVFLIIGILLFTLQMPQLLCTLFNLNKENGFLSLIKDVGKFAIGASAIGISAIGGTAANIAATPDNIKNVKNSFSNASGSMKNFKTNLATSHGLFGKLGVFGSTIKNVAGVPISILRVPGSIVAGGVSSSARTAKKLAENKGTYKSGDVTSSIRDSSMARESRNYGISGFDSKDIQSEIDALQTRQTNLNDQYAQGQEFLSFSLANEENPNDIENAFKQHYSSYSEYVSEMTARGEGDHIINEGIYNKYDSLYSKQDDMDNELEQIKERLELLEKHKISKD